MKCEVCNITFNGLYINQFNKAIISKRCKKCLIKYFDEFTPQELEEHKKKACNG